MANGKKQAAPAEDWPETATTEERLDALEKQNEALLALLEKHGIKLPAED